MAVRITGAQRNESLEAMPLLDDVPLILQPHGGRRRRPDALYGDRQYGTPRNRKGSSGADRGPLGAAANATR